MVDENHKMKKKKLKSESKREKKNHIYYIYLFIIRLFATTFINAIVSYENSGSWKRNGRL